MRSIILLFVTVYSLFATVYSPEYTYAEHTLRVSTSVKPPLSTLQKSGYLDLLLQELFTRINYTIDIVRLPSERALYALNTGSCDVDLPRIAGIETQYTNTVRIPEPVITYRFTAFSLTPIPHIASWQDLKNTNLAYTIGWKIYEKNVPPNAKALALPTAEQLFKALKKQHAFVVLHEELLGTHAAKKCNIPKVYTSSPLAVRKMYMYVHSSRAHLIPVLTTELQNMKRDGTLLRIAQWTLGLDYIP